MNNIEALAEYYRKFHHSLLSWYITIQGFVFVGLLASKIDGKLAGFICLCLIIVSLVSFVGMIGVYSDRIAILEGYAAQSSPPTNWKKAHKDEAGVCPKGKGSWFFVFVCVMFAAANVALLLGKEIL